MAGEPGETPVQTPEGSGASCRWAWTRICPQWEPPDPGRIRYRTLAERPALPGG